MLCCVPNCSSSKNTSTNSNAQISCFKFPTNEAMKEEWLRRVPVKKFNKLTTGVCMAHFEERFLKQSSVNPLRARLVAGAVPTLFLKGDNSNETAEYSNISEYVDIELDANRIDNFEAFKSNLESMLQLDNWKVACSDDVVHIYKLIVESNGNLRVETSINIDSDLLLKIFHHDKALAMKFSKQTVHKSIKLKGWSQLQKLLDRFNNVDELKIHSEKIRYE